MKTQKNTKIKEMIIVMITTLCLLCMGTTAFAAMPAFDGDEGVCIVDETTGDALVSQQADERFYPASTTKLMTALVAMDFVGDRLDVPVTAGEEITMIDADSSLADLTQGNTYTWHQLLYGLLLPSGNDAAMTIAANVGRIHTGDENLDAAAAVEDFVVLMNAKATDLGLKNTHFVNPHGLMDSDHYTTPAELAVIAKKAMDNQTIAEVTSAPSYKGTSPSGSELSWKNSNILIVQEVSDMEASQVTALNLSSGANPYYNADALGGKTGYDEAAGRCLVFTAKGNDVDMVGVIMHASNQDVIYTQAGATITSALGDYTHISWSNGTTAYTEASVRWASLFSGFSLGVRTDGEAASTVLATEKDQYTAKANWDKVYLEENGDNLKIVQGFEEGQQVGTMDIYRGDTLVKSLPLLAMKAMNPIGLVDYAVMAVVALTIILIIAFVVSSRRKKKRMDLAYHTKRAMVEQNMRKHKEKEAPMTQAEVQEIADLPASFLDEEEKQRLMAAVKPVLRAKLGGKTRYRMKRRRKAQ